MSLSCLSQYLPITDPTLIFLTVLCIILLAPLVMSRLRIPHIIGMVLAGMAVGKYGLNILERDSSFELFGKVGLLYIMFLAGLEMDLGDIKKKKGQFLLFGMLTFFVPFLMAYPVGVYLLGYSPTASMLLACIFASNTLIAYPIVCKYGLQKHPAVALGVGSSMLALTMSLIIVAAIAGAGGGEGGVGFWLLFVAKMGVFCAGAVFLVPRLTRWFFRRYSDSVTLYIYVLSLLFLGAVASEACGLEGIFGAFLIGLILHRFIPAVSPLMNRIEFIGNALFIPYFLIGVGMLIDVSPLFRGTGTLWVVACVVLFATLGKAVAAYAAALALRMPWTSGHVMFGLTEAHAAGGIAMVMVGMRLTLPDGGPVVDAGMLNAVVMLILFSCVISSVVVEHASQDILLGDKQQGDTPPGGDDEKMLLPLQHAEDADALVQLAIMTRNKKLGRGIIGINVVYDNIDGARNRSAGRRLLDHAAATAIAADVRMQTQSRLAINIANGIKHAFKEYEASEIIMGLHRRTGPHDSFWGAYTHGLTSEINRQIFICRILRPLSTIRRIQVAVPSRVEFEPGFYRWVERLARLAGTLGCRIVFHARQESGALIAQYMQNRHPAVRAEYEPMAHWKDLTSLSRTVRDDHLLVVVTARPGTVSYKPAFERLPDELGQAFPTCSLIIIYPDQHGQPQDSMTFTAPQREERESAYAALLKWWEKRKERKQHTHS